MLMAEYYLTMVHVEYLCLERTNYGPYDLRPRWAADDAHS